MFSHNVCQNLKDLQKKWNQYSDEGTDEQIICQEKASSDVAQMQ